MADLALKWAVGGDGITSSLCGSRTVRKLATNINAVSEPLSASIREEQAKLTLPLIEKLGPSFDYWQNFANDRTQ
jgi:aryl-alcohol dehydrogenase-like predicted oxidoreductase